MENQLQVLVSEDVREQWLAQVKKQERDEDVWVLPENWPVIELFQLVDSEWRLAPMGGLLGLDYHSVLLIMSWHDIEPTNERMQDLHLFARAYANEVTRLTAKK